MKTAGLCFLIIVAGMFGACSAPKKTPAKGPSPEVTRTDVFRGGTSFTNAVVIKVTTERAGLAEEYRWLSNNYPGHSLLRRRHVTRSPRQYDIVRIRTREGKLKDVYFDCTAFWGQY